MTYLVISYRDPAKALRTVVYEYAGSLGVKAAKAHMRSWAQERLQRIVSVRVVDAADWAGLALAMVEEPT